MKTDRVIASYKDPSGFVFSNDGLVYRQINRSYQENYDLLMSSGLYQKLIDLGYLIPHQEVEDISPRENKSDLYKIIKPDQVSFISYPNEWCFSMLKDAALVTLAIQKTAIEFGMTLKDSSVYNIQFHKGKPVIIDTLSFERYQPGSPWVAYKQFVEHFLSPLALMSYVDVRLNSLFTSFTDGVPVEMAAHLLPIRAKLNPGLFLHIVAHAISQRRSADKKIDQKQLRTSFSKNSLLGLIDSLEGSVKGLRWQPKGTEWQDYYQCNNNYRSSAMLAKEKIVSQFTNLVKPNTVWDLGANTGQFSRIVTKENKGKTQIISFDIDYGALENNYHQVKTRKEANILPLFSDLTNPTPAIGWANQERKSLLDRGPSDMILALALVHHLAIGKNVPLVYIAKLFSSASESCVVEFVPKEDSQVKKLLMNRQDIFSDYNKDGFERAFEKYFTLVKKIPVQGSKRTIYLYKHR